MKIATTYLFTIVIWLSSSLLLNAESLVFEFQDNIGDDLALGYLPTGDITDVKVVIDTMTGDYTVTLNTTASGFHLSALFELNLKNVNQPQSEVVTLSASIDALGSPTSIQFSTADGIFPTEPGLIGWQKDDYVVTSGEHNGTPFTSGTFSVGGTLPYDSLDYGGILIPDPNQLPSELNDSDMDGVPDETDMCDTSDFSETVIILGINTWIPNIKDANFISEHDGLTLADTIQLMQSSAAENPKNHGQYVQKLVREFKMLEKDGLINQRDNYTLTRIIVRKQK